MQTIDSGEIAVLTFLLLALGFPLWRILRKMGYPGIVGLIALIPGVNLLLAYYLALSEWPVLRQLNILKRQAGGS